MVESGQSCENVRQVVEICDVRKDLQRFVHREGGGSVITGRLPGSFIRTSAYRLLFRGRYAAIHGLLRWR